MSLLSPSIGGLMGLFNGFAVALGITGILALLLIPSLLAEGAKPTETAHALYRYILQGIGAVLMTLSGLPALYGVLTNRALPQNGYLALLIVFAFGGIVYLWNEGKTERIAPASRLVPSLIFRYAFKFIAFVAMAMAVTSLLTTLLFSSWPFPDSWFGSPLVFFCYSCFLLWCTHFPAPKEPTAHWLPWKKSTAHGFATVKTSRHAKKK